MCVLMQPLRLPIKVDCLSIIVVEIQLIAIEQAVQSFNACNLLRQSCLVLARVVQLLVD